MRFVFYTHSLISDWNHGNAHFLRGVMRELLARGHEAVALEPADGWSRDNLIKDRGLAPLARFQADFPELVSVSYGTDFPHEEVLADADVVVVHEWTDPRLVARIGDIKRRGGGFTLLFHDTHHRAVSAAPEIGALNLEDYDCILAFGDAVRERYLKAGWGSQVVTWHEAADTRLFRPMPEYDRERDVVWIGNWGDDERAEELQAYLLDPVREHRLDGTVHGVRYPPEALEKISAAGLSYGGWIANADAPRAFARHRLAVHVPRRPYASALPGIPTIRVFEALACGMPLVCAPWTDSEALFRPGRDFLVAADSRQMSAHVRDVVRDPQLAAELARSGLQTVKARHTCAHRVDELLATLRRLGTARARSSLPAVEAAE